MIRIFNRTKLLFYYFICSLRNHITALFPPMLIKLCTQHGRYNEMLGGYIFVAPENANCRYMNILSEIRGRISNIHQNIWWWFAITCSPIPILTAQINQWIKSFQKFEKIYIERFCAFIFTVKVFLYNISSSIVYQFINIFIEFQIQWYWL